MDRKIYSSISKTAKTDRVEHISSAEGHILVEVKMTLRFIIELTELYHIFSERELRRFKFSAIFLRH